MYGAHQATISAEQINGFGVKSLSFAQIDSKQLPKMEVNLFGEEAGYGAQIYCQGNSKCIINCKVSGCNGLTVYCDIENGAKCDIKPNLCAEKENGDKNVDGVDCPILEQHYTNYDLEEIQSFDIELKASIINELEMNDGGESINGNELNDDIIDGLLVGDSPYDFVMGNGIEIMASNTILYSNILTACIVFLVTVLMVDWYFRIKYGDK